MTRKKRRRPIKAAAKSPLLCMVSEVAIKAEEGGDESSTPTFEVTAYTGGAMTLAGWDRPVVIDLDGMSFGNSIVANLDHDRSKRVGNVTAKSSEDGKLVLSGLASAATDHAREVVESAANGFVWQASVEAQPDVLSEVNDGETIQANGQEFSGPLYLASKSTLKGFAFVSHGADDNTSVTIAAEAGKTHSRENDMNPELQTWIEAMGFDVDDLSEDQLASLTANYEGRQVKKPKGVMKLSDGIAAKAENKERTDAITQIALNACDTRPYDIAAIQLLAEEAIETKWSVDKFRLELMESGQPGPVPPWRGVREADRLTNNVLEAAVCQAARLPDIEKHYDDRTLQAAHDKFKGRIGLKQLFLIAAEANGHHKNHSNEVDRDTLRAAFSNQDRPAIRASGFSVLTISNVVAATANKFIMRGWNSVDQTALRLAKIQNVRNFQTVTTVSLTDTAIYEKVGSDGEIKHGTLGDLTYTNKADTYARMLAITRQDIINDDLGALTDVPMKLGNGAMKKLNDIFWTEFLGLVGAAFFASGNSNINTGVATMTAAGIDATYVIFKNQTNPDGTPLGVEPAIILVPTALEGAALRQVRSEQYVTGATTLEGSNNIWANRFEVLSSPYISNSSYTGNTSVAWWMLANPEILPVIGIAALNGQVEPTVDTAEADFDVLGVQMRGYNDVGVNDQEYRGGVHSDGGAS